MLALASAISTPARGSDLEREARLAEEIEANIFDGEVISLDAAGQAFVAVEMASQTDSTRGVVILLHGRGFHADWPENIGPLRVGLSEAGWHTLSVQMPVLPAPPRQSKRLHLWNGAAVSPLTSRVLFFFLNTPCRL